MMPSTPQQSSHSSCEELVTDRKWTYKEAAGVSAERKVIAKMEDYLNQHDNVKVEVEELELMMSPEDPEVNLRYVLMNASRRGRNIFEILSTKGRREHFVASKVRLEQRQRQREEMSYEGGASKSALRTPGQG